MFSYTFLKSQLILLANQKFCNNKYKNKTKSPIATHMPNLKHNRLIESFLNFNTNIIVVPILFLKLFYFKFRIKHNVYLKLLIYIAVTVIMFF